MSKKPKRIMVVEDELLVAEDIAECLQMRGFEVCGTAKSSEEALALADEFRPDLALMDIVIQGDRDGIDTAEILKERYNIPVIFLTAYSQSGMVERAKVVSPLGYVTKPFEEKSLLSTVEIALHKSGLDEELRKSAEWFSTTLNSIGDGVIATDSDGNVKYLNDLAEIMTGWDRESAEGRRIDEVFEIINETTRAKVSNPALEAIESGQIRELANHTLLINLDGAELPIDDSGAPIRNDEGKIIGAVLVFRDVTEKKKREKEILNYQRQLEDLVRQRTSELEWRVELESVAVEISTELIRLKNDEYANGLQKAVERIGVALNLDGCGIYEVGSEPGSATFLPVCRWVSQLDDEALAKERQFTSTDYPVWESLLAKDGQIVVRSRNDIPPEAVAEREQMETMNLQSLVCLRVGPTESVRWVVTFASHKVQEWNEEELIFLQMFANILKSVLERRELEASQRHLQEQLSQAQKLEAIGKLTGGIAHDFNNMLVPILGYADSILTETESNQTGHSELIEIRRAAKSAADLTRQLLAFSRKQVLDRKPLCLNQLIEEMRQFLGRILGEDIEIKSDLDPVLATVEADRSQMEQVIMNLSVNARDAMPEGGILTIRTRSEIGDNGCKTTVLEVEDTGCGIAQDILEKIFDPFYSTKGLEGTGLGLSVVLGVTQQHDGWVKADSVVGEGSRFTIGLAASDKLVEVKKLQPSSGFEKPRAGQRILLIEDEPAVLKFVTRALEKRGFDIVSVMNKKDAIETFDRENGRFDLIFTDAKLPDGNGIEILEYIFQKDQSMRALISSGYTDNRALVDQAKLRGVEFLQKPYALDTLHQTVRSVLSNGTPTEVMLAS